MRSIPFILLLSASACFAQFNLSGVSGGGIGFTPTGGGGGGGCPYTPDATPKLDQELRNDYFSQGTSSDNFYIGQIFTNSTPTNISSVAWTLYTLGGNTSGKTYTTGIWTADNSGNLTSLLGSTNFTGFNTGAYTWVTNTFACAITSPSTTNIAITLTTGGTDAVNYVIVGQQTTDVIPGYRASWVSGGALFATYTGYDLTLIVNYAH